jgi:transcription antitermination factor NusG
VTIVEGPLTGVTDVILRKKTSQRHLVVIVNLLGRAVAVELSEEAVESYH